MGLCATTCPRRLIDSPAEPSLVGEDARATSIPGRLESCTSMRVTVASAVPGRTIRAHKKACDGGGEGDAIGSGVTLVVANDRQRTSLITCLESDGRADSNFVGARLRYDLGGVETVPPVTEISKQLPGAIFNALRSKQRLQRRRTDLYERIAADGDQVRPGGIGSSKRGSRCSSSLSLLNATLIVRVSRELQIEEIVNHRAVCSA